MKTLAVLKNSRKKPAEFLLAKARVVFWDFDGVIKESLEVKGRAFASLFPDFPAGLRAKILAHHATVGGISRWEKIPIYLKWAGEQVSSEKVRIYASRFASLVKEGVLKKKRVPGVREYLCRNPHNQRFCLLSATPQEELEDLAKSLELIPFFQAIHGWPKKKSKPFAMSF
jgi:phosphoglycolate phosphatase-like HAD superfamily hydrolase